MLNVVALQVRIRISNRPSASELKRVAAFLQALVLPVWLDLFGRHMFPTPEAAVLARLNTLTVLQK